MKLDAQTTRYQEGICRKTCLVENNYLLLTLVT